MTVHIPTTEEIHQIAYLTMHGWFPNDNGTWSKEGVKRDPPEDWSGRPVYQGDLHEWDLLPAYEKQRYGR